jgi:protein O-GlcNAc transferase
MGDHQAAIASYDQALACQPGLADAHLGRAYSLARLNRYAQALSANSRALAINPRRAEALINQGNLLRALRRFQEALVSYEQALTLQADHVEALNNRGSALDDLGRTDEALQSYDKALAIEPNHATVLFNRGNTLLRMQRYDQAIASYERTLAVDPDHPRALGFLAHAYLTICDWTKAKAIEASLTHQIAHDRAAISPFALLGFDVSQSAQQKAAQHFTRREFPSAPRAFARLARQDRQKIRIAYVSADFCSHATMALAAGLFERHDRDRFEVVGISFGPDDGSTMRRRAEAAFDQFHDVRSQTDDDICALMLKLGIDIAVDLKGYTEGARPGILARRPAPIQVSYLGYPGTMGAEFIDYILADRFVLPPEEQRYYSEKVVYLPDGYQVNDAGRQSFQHIPSRREAGLPDTGFVFCCFNNSWKMRETVVRIWMKLLHSVPESILWLLQTNEFATSNLRQYARMHAIDPERLIFAPKVSVTEHLARLCIADIFLDTLPYGAHTTASDALFVGMPIVTCPGNTFAGRVAGSLLATIDMHDLIASRLAEYEALALKLASDPAELQSVRRRLQENRFKSPLFDTGRFCHHLEEAYLTMWNAWQRGESPRGFSVERSKSPP